MKAEKWNFYFRLILGILNHIPFAAGLCINETLSYDSFFFYISKNIWWNDGDLLEIDAVVENSRLQVVAV